MGIFRRIGKWWRKRQREIDRSLLFPEIEESAVRNDVDEFGAQSAKLTHICIDPAWRYPEEWKDEEPELYEILVER